MPRGVIHIGVKGGDQLAARAHHLIGHRGAVARALSSRAVTVLPSHSCLGAQPTLHMGNLKVQVLCLAACALLHQRKSSQKLSGINCLATTIQLTGQEPATFECPCRLQICSRLLPLLRCVVCAWLAIMRCANNLRLCSHAVVKG